MAEEALEAGARAVLTFLEAAFPSGDVTRLAAPPAARLPADALYFRIEDEGGVLGTVGVTPDIVRGHTTTALVERLHVDDLPEAVRRAGRDACVIVAADARPAVIPLG